MEPKAEDPKAEQAKTDEPATATAVEPPSKEEDK